MVFLPAQRNAKNGFSLIAAGLIHGPMEAWFFAKIVGDNDFAVSDTRADQTRG